jgi:hypothetical protein
LGELKREVADREPRSIDEKRGVPRNHENMLPGNSFPQICVVSGNKYVEKTFSDARVPKEGGSK